MKGTATYVIGGGVAPYTITSSNAAFVPVQINHGFTVSWKNNTLPVTVTFTVTDSKTPTAETASVTLIVK